MDSLASSAAAVREVVRTVRSVLAERWPAVTFEVRTVERATWARLDVHWDDGPTRLAVQQLVEATVAAVVGDDPQTPALETHTRRTITEGGVAAALAVVTDTPPPGWVASDRTVSWMRLTIPQAQALMDELTLPQPPASVHHLAAMLADRIDLSVALDPRRTPPRRRR